MSSDEGYTPPFAFERSPSYDVGKFFLRAVDDVAATGTLDGTIWRSFDPVGNLWVGTISDLRYQCASLSVFKPEGENFIEYLVTMYRSGFFSFRGRDDARLRITPIEEPEDGFRERFLMFKEMIEVSDRFWIAADPRKVFREFVEEKAAEIGLDKLTEEQSRILRETAEFVEHSAKTGLSVVGDVELFLLRYALGDFAIRKLGLAHEFTSTEEEIAKMLLRGVGGLE